MARNPIAWLLVLLVLATFARGTSAGRLFRDHGTVASNSSRTILKFLRPKESKVKVQLVDSRNGNVIGDIVNGTTISVRHLESTGIGRRDFAVRVIPGWRTRAVMFESRSKVLRRYDYLQSRSVSHTIAERLKRKPFTALRLEASDTHRLLILSSIKENSYEQHPEITFSIGPLVYACDASKDTCGRKFNGWCDAEQKCGKGPNTDCFDCDPCQQYNLQSCEACTTAPEGCVWCGTEARCLTTGTPLSVTMTCQASDFTSNCTQTTPSVFSDPLLESMEWLYDMINVKDVWRAGITGKGVGIRINDIGVDSDHPEIESKFDVASSCPLFKPYVLKVDFNQGTASASMAAASGNSSCAVGIAPDARLSSCRVLPSPILDNLIQDFFLDDDVYFDLSTDKSSADSSYLYKYMATMHISSNSFIGKSCLTRTRRGRNLSGGPCPFLSNHPTSPCLTEGCSGVNWSNLTASPTCKSDVLKYCQDSYNNKDLKACSSIPDWFSECRYTRQSLAEQQALTEGIINGRNGKGIIYVFAAGNEFARGDDVNFDGALNSRYVISVGAVGKDKAHASYSTPGAALFVSAPGGDSRSYHSPVNVVALAGGGCVDGGYGTEFASPVVSGVIALILQVNDNLTWRDVQGIIASTSQKVFPNDPSWTTNAAGLHHSYLYGFGIIDAKKAVEAAQTWVNYNVEQQIIAESGPVNMTIAEFQTPSVWTTSTINVSTPVNVTVESVTVYIDLTHSSRGDLDIVLVSPQGTSSILAPGERPENEQLGDDERWRLMTVRNWGESANGNWTLRLVDRSPGDLATCVNFPGWAVNITVVRPTTILRAGNYGCDDFASTRSCVSGRQGSGFVTWFFGLATSINDPVLKNTRGISPVQACCVCGGGRSASTVPDVLKSWRIAVSGH